jgi:hypothetical protein
MLEPGRGVALEHDLRDAVGATDIVPLQFDAHEQIAAEQRLDAADHQIAARALDLDTREPDLESLPL